MKRGKLIFEAGRVSLILLAGAVICAELNAAEGRPMIVCFGDSITAGTYPVFLAELLPEHHVVNAGVGGNTTGAGLKRMAEDVLAKTPSYVLIMFGTNDSVLTAPGQYKTPLPKFRKNLETMVRECRKVGAVPILATLLPIIHEPYYTRHPIAFYTPEGGLGAIVERYRQTTGAVAKEMDVALVDMNQEIHGDLTHLKPDGVHPNEAGEKEIAAQFARALKAVIGGQEVPEKLRNDGAAPGSG